MSKFVITLVMEQSMTGRSREYIDGEGINSCLVNEWGG